MSLASVSQVMGDYFNAMGISLLHGRTFTPADKDGAPLVAIVNRKLAEHYWPGQDAIGKRIRWGVADTPTPWMTVVGEVDDVKQDSPDKDTSEQIYQPTDQMAAAYGPFGSSAGVALAGNAGFIVVSTSLPPEQMAQTMITTVHGLDPQLALTQLQTLENVVAGSEAPRRFNTGVITAFAAAAVLLAIVGIYSVIAFSVTLRIPEMAIRMALGSQRIGVLRLILITGAKLAGIGCALGLIGALAVSPLLRALLFAVSPFDPMVLAVAIAVVLLLALAASMLPARRAASIDPMQALRAE
jgi:predicted permease